MPRIRSLKPEFWADEDLADLPRDARLLYMGLWNLADEHGRLRGDARYVKGQLFPYDDDLSPDAIDKLVDLLTDAGKVRRYSSAGRAYLFLPNLAKHQRLEPSKVDSKLPPPPELSQPQAGPDETAHDSDGSGRRADENALLYGSGIRGQGSGVRDADASAPAPEPPLRCEKHLTANKVPNCGACADARRAHVRWEAERAKRLASAPKCRLHAGEPADNCGRCRSEELAPA